MQGFEQCGRGKEFWTRCGLGDHDKLGRQANDVLHQLFAACRTKYVHADPFQVGFQGGACCARVSEDQCCAHRCLVPLTNLPQESCQARMLLDPGWDATRRSYRLVPAGDSASSAARSVSWWIAPDLVVDQVRRALPRLQRVARLPPSHLGPFVPIVSGDFSSRAHPGPSEQRTAGETMSYFRNFLRAGHPPTLAAAFFYLTFTFVVWVLNGAMAPFISEAYHLTPAQKGLMLSIPIVAGALMRFPLGVLAQYIGRKRATLVEMGLIAVAMLYGYLHVHSFGDLLAMGVLLGVAGASFGVAMSLGSGWFPPQYKGLAMGLVGAGNVGTAIAVLVAPPLAQAFGWQTVYAMAAASVAVPAIVMIVFAKEPPDVNRHATVREQLACLFEKDGWAFSLIYVITFGGFIGLASFLPTYYYDQFSVSKVQAGQLAMLAAFMGSALRIFGGWISDHWGGVNTLSLVMLLVVVCLLLGALAGNSLTATTL